MLSTTRVLNKLIYPELRLARICPYCTRPVATLADPWASVNCTCGRRLTLPAMLDARSLAWVDSPPDGCSLEFLPWRVSARMITPESVVWVVAGAFLLLLPLWYPLWTGTWPSWSSTTLTSTAFIVLFGVGCLAFGAGRASGTATLTL
ncbi:MAG TPA: hypothetical protein VEB22_02800, partial [Phycisphaerales bacterium]|nr:hypothetical protein [Phycisphaerales bacterium]